MLETMGPAQILVDHTTASAIVARELSHAAGAVGSGFIDAPVSGGQAGAENGVLTVMCGGAEETYRRGRGHDRLLCQVVQAVGRYRFRSIDEDGQPDLHRWTACRDFRKD